ncbi:MAG TPA: glycosyltransferase 87 family protein [Acidimicrobiales bacterium]|nr:glycosyltransferase 87 family protein [Acidimicrobiales bacterium]
MDTEVDAPGIATAERSEGIRPSPAGPAPPRPAPVPPPAAPPGLLGAVRARTAVLGPLACTTAWMVWAYLRTRLPAAPRSARASGLGYRQWAYGHFAYSDVVNLYHTHHLADHAFPYVHTAIEYPVLTGLFMWGAAWAPGVGGYLLASAAGLLVCAWGTVVLLHRCSPRAAWLFALSPLLLVFGLLNWDLLAIVLMVGGWDCYRHRRYGWAGVLLMAGTCAKFFPVLLLGLCVVGCFADRRDGAARRGGVRMAATATATALVLNVPFAVLNLDAWSHFFRFNAARGGGEGLLYQLHIATSWSIGTFDTVSALLVLAVLGALALWVLRGAPVAPAAAAAFTTLMLFNKVFSPQYMLWVLVFGLLAAWPGWTVAAVTVAGLVDFANAMVILHLAGAGSPAAPWYAATAFPMDRALRTVVVACGLGVSLWRGWGDPGAARRRRHRGVVRARSRDVRGVPG